MDKERQIYRYINKELWCTIPGYKGYGDITKELSRGVKYKNKRVTKEQVVYIYTCSKTVKQLKKELNIKETTIYAIRSQQNHYKTTKNLVKGDW